MTSTSPEPDNSSSPATGRPSAADPSRTTGAGGASNPAPAGSGGASRDAGRAAASTGPASKEASPDAASKQASTAPRGRSTAPGTAPSSTKKGAVKDKKDGKSAASGGDWNVFRTVVVLVGIVIAGFGAYYLILGTAGLPDTEADPANPTLESQFRFFSAMMVGVGAAFITIAIKFQWANMLWLVCLMVFIGGIGRVLSWAFSGTPNYILIILMIVELAFPPALLVWHKYIAKTSDLRREFAQRS